MKYLLVVALVLLTITPANAADTLNTRTYRSGEWVYTIDRAEYEKVFTSCITNSKGPLTTHYHDWDESIKACEVAAREIATIKEELKPLICEHGWGSYTCREP